MAEERATVWRRMDYVGNRDGWPYRVFINSDNYRKFTSGEDGISGITDCPTPVVGIRVNNLDAKDLVLGEVVEPDTFLECFLWAADQVFPQATQ